MQIKPPIEHLNEPVLRFARKDFATLDQNFTVEQALASVGGKLDAVYFALGEWDVFLICDCPDSVTAAAVGLTVSATGLVRTKTTALLTVEEVDKALSKMVSYRPPGA